jgi:hypothetical protein
MLLPFPGRRVSLHYPGKVKPLFFRTEAEKFLSNRTFHN